MGQQAIALVHRQIRRAVQSPLITAAEGAGWAPATQLQWRGIQFDRDKLRLVQPPLPYISSEMAVDDVIVREIGPNPMFEGRGHLTMNIHTPGDAGEDANDVVLAWVAAAYPYSGNPSFDGITVNIDKMQHRGYGMDGPWLTGLVSVDWNIYRRS